MKVTSVTMRLEEKVGLPNYSNVTYSASITAEPEEGETADDVLASAETTIEGWMKDYFRREVQTMLENATS